MASNLWQSKLRATRGILWRVTVSATQLTERMGQLIDNESLRRQMGARGREVCELRYTWRRTVQQLLELGGMPGL